MIEDDGLNLTDDLKAAVSLTPWAVEFRYADPFAPNPLDRAEVMRRASRIAAPQLGYVPRNTRTARTRRWSSAAGARLSFAKILVTCLSTARSVITSIAAIA